MDDDLLGFAVLTLGNSPLGRRCAIAGFRGGGGLKCTTFAARLEGALVFLVSATHTPSQLRPPPLLVAPFKLACKRHLPESEIGLTLRRRPRRRRMGGVGEGGGEASTISGLFSFLKLDQLSNIQSVAGDWIAVGNGVGASGGEARGFWPRSARQGAATANLPT